MHVYEDRVDGLLKSCAATALHAGYRLDRITGRGCRQELSFGSMVSPAVVVYDFWRRRPNECSAVILVCVLKAWSSL